MPGAGIVRFLRIGAGSVNIIRAGEHVAFESGSLTICTFVVGGLYNKGRFVGYCFVHQNDSSALEMEGGFRSAFQEAFPNANHKEFEFLPKIVRTAAGTDPGQFGSNTRAEENGIVQTDDEAYKNVYQWFRKPDSVETFIKSGKIQLIGDEGRNCRGMADKDGNVHLNIPEAKTFYARFWQNIESFFPKWYG